MTVNLLVCSLLRQKCQAFFKEAITSANLSYSRNVPFLIELFIISVNVVKYVSTESIATFTGIKEQMADLFLFQDFMNFFTSSDDTSFK